MSLHKVNVFWYLVFKREGGGVDYYKFFFTFWFGFFIASEDGDIVTEKCFPKLSALLHSP